MTEEITERDVAKVIAILESATGKPSPPMSLNVWSIAIQVLSRNVMFAAVERFVCENVYPVFPTPGAIRRRAIDLVCGVPLLPEEAYASVSRAISSFSEHDDEGPSEFLGEEIWTVVEGLGGWGRFTDRRRNQTTLFAQFRDAWIRATEKKQMSRLLPQEIQPKMISAPDPALAPMFHDQLMARIEENRARGVY